MIRIYSRPECEYTRLAYDSDLLVQSPDVNDDGTEVKVDDDEGGNAWTGGRSNGWLWEDPDAESDLM